MKSNSLGRRLSLALVLAGTLVLGLALVSRPVGCIDREVEKLIDDEWRMLGKDDKLFNSFATDLAVGKICHKFTIRRRLVYDEIQALKAKRRMEISSSLEKASKDRREKIGPFRRNLADKHVLSAHRLLKLVSFIREVCDDHKLKGSNDFSTKLEEYLNERLETRLYTNVEMRKSNWIPYWEDKRADPWNSVKLISKEAHDDSDSGIGINKNRDDSNDKIESAFLGKEVELLDGVQRLFEE
jgi:hypothetical protein